MKNKESKIIWFIWNIFLCTIVWEKSQPDSFDSLKKIGHFLASNQVGRDFIAMECSLNVACSNKRFQTKKIKQLKQLPINEMNESKAKNN